jgi:hypothetical protein
MSIRKKGTCSGSPVVSSSVLVCNSCGHTEIVTGDMDTLKECPKCKSTMSLVSSSCKENISK